MSTRVTHVITKLDVGGAQTHVVELALAQLDGGYQVDIVAGVAGPAADRALEAGVPVRIVPELGASRARLSQRAALAAVMSAIRELSPHVVHGHSSNGGLSARLAARRLGRPSVYTAHGWPFQRGAGWKQRAMSFAGELVGGHVGDAVIVLTEAERARAIRARVVPPNRLWVVPNGVADVPPALRRPSHQGDRPPTLVMVARFAPPKLQAELIGAVAELSGARWLLQFVGDGPGLDDCRAAAASLPELGARVAFLGHRDDVDEVLAAADVGILWSRYEGLPISVIEYMRAGLCCVASDLPGTRALFGPEPAGLLAGSRAELVGQLRQVIAQPASADDLGRRARRRYEEHYSATAMAAATDAVYESVLAARS